MAITEPRNNYASQLQNSGCASASLHFYADFLQKSAWRGMLACPRKEFCNYLMQQALREGLSMSKNVCFCMVILLSSISFLYGTEKDILIDDFENGIDNWRVIVSKTLKKDTASLEISDSAFEGNSSASVKIQEVLAEEYSYILIGRTINIEQNDRNLVPKGSLSFMIKSSFKNIQLRLRLSDTDSHLAERIITVETIPSKWKKISVPIQSFATIGSELFDPQKLSSFYFVWRGLDWKRTCFDIDKIQLKLNENDLVFNTSQAFVFRNTDKNIKVKIEDINEAIKNEATSFKATIIDKDNHICKSQEITPSAKDFVFSLEGLSPGEYQVKIEVLKGSNVLCQKGDNIMILDEIDMPSKISFTENNIMKIDNNPFFPLGLYCVGQFGDIEAEIKDSKSMGFNAVQNYHLNPCNSLEYTKKYLTLAQKYGMKVMTGGVGRINNPERKNFISRFRNHPAIIVNYVDDEPSYPGCEVGDVHKYIKTLDPNRPTAIVHYEIQRYKDLVGRTDIFIADRYPVGEPGLKLTAVRDRVIAATEASGGKIPVWYVIQALDKKFYNPKLPGGLPSRKQERFMVYSAIVNGATGLWFYSYEGGSKKTWTIDFRNDLTEILKEIKEISPVIFSNKYEAVNINIVPNIKDLRKDFKFMAKKVDTDIYIIAVNESEVELKATFSIMEKTTHLCNVMFEKRSPDIDIDYGADNKCFTDKFLPYDVHVYKLSPEQQQ